MVAPSPNMDSPNVLIRVHLSLFEISHLVGLGADIQEIFADILAIRTLVGRPHGPGTL